MKRLIRIAFADFWHPHTPEAIRAQNPIYQLLSRHYELQLSEQPDFLIYSCFGKRHLKHDCTRIYYTGENRRPDFDACDFAFSFDYPMDERNFRLPLYRLWDDYEDWAARRPPLPDPGQQKFCNFLYSNRKARERIRFYRLLEQYRRIDSGGKVMNNLGGRVGDKMEFLSGYKFTIAFENSSHPGYTTEKLFEALVAGTVPIYWGNPLAGRDFNPERFINCHDFDNFAAVVERVKEIDRDDEQYLACLAAPLFPGGVETEFVREDNILARFEAIFSGSTRSRVASGLDRVWYRVHPGHVYDGLHRLYWRYLK